jgi:hypothetical protein
VDHVQARLRNRQPAESAHESEQQALEEERPYDLQPRRAEGQADGEVVPSRDDPCQREVREVCARDEEDEHDDDRE